MKKGYQDGTTDQNNYARAFIAEIEDKDGRKNIKGYGIVNFFSNQGDFPAKKEQRKKNQCSGIEDYYDELLGNYRNYNAGDIGNNADRKREQQNCNEQFVSEEG